MAELLQLFATPVIVDDLPDATAFSDALAPAILERRTLDQGVKLSNRGGWQSRRDFDQWSGDFGRRLVDRALQLANRHTGSTLAGPLRWTVDSWANVNDRGGYNNAHVHGGTFWSCVYYVKVEGKGGGELVLHDPRMPGLRMHAPNLRFKDGGAEVRAKIIPVTGRMILFPGWLSHSVEPWEGDGERISVAMNIRALPPAQG